MSSHQIDLGDGVAVTLQRTLRVPDDAGDHPLPPSLGTMPVAAAQELSAGARDLLGIGDAEHVVALREGEALWLSFSGRGWHPAALKVGLGGTCAVTGEAFAADAPPAEHQDYLVVPDQPWLDGVSTGDGFVRQFVAATLGAGATVEEQLRDEPAEGGLRFATFRAKPGRFPDEPPAFEPMAGFLCCASPELGLAAGGRIEQDIYDDPYGPGTWESVATSTVRVALVDAVAFAAVTGRPPAAPPITAREYTNAGLPWFVLRDPARQALEVSAKLASVRSLAELRGWPDDVMVVDPGQVIALLNRHAVAR